MTDFDDPIRALAREFEANNPLAAPGGVKALLVVTDYLVAFGRAVAERQREADAPYMQHTRGCISNMQVSNGLGLVIPNCTCGFNELAPVSTTREPT